MKIETDEKGNHILTAEDDMAIHQVNSPSPTTTIKATLKPNVDVNTWEDCEFGEPEIEDIKRYSTLSIKRELSKIGKWAIVKQMMSNAGVVDDFYLANYLSSQDPIFQEALPKIVEAGILTLDELDEILKSSEWTSD